MNKDKRETLRNVHDFLGKKVADKGNSKYGNEKFSFKEMVTVKRDDRIHAYRGMSITAIAKLEKMSRKGVYNVLKKKMN